MKANIYLLVLFFNLSAALSGQVLQIPLGTSVAVDGHVSAAEWMGSDTVSINISAGTTTEVIYKHDGTSLYLAFLGNLQSAGSFFPEVVMDINHDQAATFQNDDWWFHVSATDCEFQGQYGNYSNCQSVRPNWKAEPNFQMSGPATDTVEVEIPFQTLGLATSDTIGIAFVLNNFQTYRYYPLGADHLDPSSWHAAVLSGSLTSVQASYQKGEIKVWPNPVSDFLTVEWEPNNKPYLIKLQNLRGQTVWESAYNAMDGKVVIPTEKLSKGCYWISIRGQKVTLSEKVMVK